MSEKNLSRRSFLKALSAFGAAAATTAVGIPALAEESAAVFTPGTYVGKASGFSSDVTVTITVDEKRILSAAVEAGGETAEIGGAAADKLAEQLLAAQSHEIDGVSGATRTTEAVRQAAASALAQAKGVDVEALLASETKPESTDWLGQEPEIADSDIAEIVETEVLVVGAGHAGSFAAATAAELGAKTLLIEKFGHDMASGIRDTLAAVNSKQQIEANDNPDMWDVGRYIRNWSQGYADPKLVRAFLENSGETMDWYTEVLKQGGMDFRFEVDDHTKPNNYVSYDVGHSVQYGEEYYDQLTMDKVLDYATAKGLEVRYETTMVKLVKTGERVTGIIAKRADGAYVRINASKGVILCTGGYSANLQMMEALQPWSLEQCCINYSTSGAKGDGIKACLWAGAAMDDTHCAMIFERGAIKPDQAGKTDDGQLFWMGSQPFLKVNLNGERFMNEYMPYDYVLHTASTQPHHTYATVWDSNYPAYCEKFDTHGCSRLFLHENGAYPVFPMEMVMGMNEELIAGGYIVKADTIEELAEKLGLPVDTFKATVARYNELYAKGVDEDFGKEAYRLSAMDTAPFYGVRQAGGYLICSMDGIRINENMNAIREDGTAIEGLYVCGDASGSFFHGSYPNLLAGCAAGRSATFARMAARNAVKG